jgi:riboflavin kinase / FMN adenylyltransferase
MRHTAPVSGTLSPAMNAVVAPGPSSADPASQASVVTVGVFDGVHRGHRALLARARAVADQRGLPLTCLTFEPHPMSVVRPEFAPPMLSSVTQRLRLLADVGVDVARVVRFDHDLSQVSAEQFVRDYLVADVHAAVVAVGPNFRFGHRAQGEVALLEAMSGPLGFEVEPIELAMDGDQAWSSTMIRRMVAEGDVAAAAEGLMRPHRVEGFVVRGDGRGRQLGFPTANVAVPATCCRPADGVYAGRLLIAPYGPEPLVVPAAVSVGANTTFDGREPRVEAHVLDGDDWELYDRFVAVDFVRRLRDMHRFESADALVSAMRADVDQARAVLS